MRSSPLPWALLVVMCAALTACAESTSTGRGPSVSEQIHELYTRAEIGDRVELAIVRAGHRRTLSVELSARPGTR